MRPRNHVPEARLVSCLAPPALAPFSFEHRKEALPEIAFDTVVNGCVSLVCSVVLIILPDSSPCMSTLKKSLCVLPPLKTHLVDTWPNWGLSRFLFLSLSLNL